MLSYIGKRILSLIPVLFVVSFVVFLVVYMIPGGPATAILGLEASANQINALNAQLGFDRPFLVQYGDWIVNVFQGNWGDSFFLHESVTEAIAEYFGPTSLVPGSRVCTIGKWTVGTLEISVCSSTLTWNCTSCLYYTNDKIITS